jgi:hypothetical protein
MDWEAPCFEEIRMDAEFTAYLDDLPSTADDEARPLPPPR